MQSSKHTLLPNPREKSNIISNLTFAWTIPLFQKGYTKILELSDVFRPLNCDQSKLLGDRLEKWVHRKKQKIYKCIEIDKSWNIPNCSSLFVSNVPRKWEKELTESKRPSLLVALVATFWREYGLLCLISASNDLIAQLGQPLLLGQLLLYFQ